VDLVVTLVVGAGRATPCGDDGPGWQIGHLVRSFQGRLGAAEGDITGYFWIK
jgi:hypothetical protein